MAPESLREQMLEQKNSEALAPQGAAGVPGTWGAEDRATSLAGGTLRPGRPGRGGPGYSRVKGAAGEIPAPPAPPPWWRRRAVGGGEAAERADHGQLQSGPVSRAAAEPAWTEGSDRLCKPEAGDGRLGARSGDYADAPGESGTAAAGVWSSQDRVRKGDLGSRGVPGPDREIQAPGPWRRREAAEGRAGILPAWSAAAAGGAGLQEGRGVEWRGRAGPLAAAGARLCRFGALEPCLRRSRGLRVSGSGSGAGDPPPPHGLTAFYPQNSPLPLSLISLPLRGRSRQIQGCPPAPPKSHLPPKKIPPPSPSPPRLPGGRGPFNRRLTDGDERPMGGSVGAGRRLDPASTPAGRGRAGGEREAGHKARRPIGARRAAAGAGGGARQGDDVTWSE
uniref:collagen alpha-1(II) chain-like n=1 Tax=Macaca mulatta TaxID=9544 RepID=UPI0010A2819A|nr:collagen alpha-1(II) chain-like [Macaca mulatta]